MTSSLDVFFFFNDTATTEIYTLSLHDALPISRAPLWSLWWKISQNTEAGCLTSDVYCPGPASARPSPAPRSEEHTSELQSRQYLVCRLLLEKKKKTSVTTYNLQPCPLHVLDCL